MTSTIKVDTISENTSANGVAVDGVTLKDGAVASTAATTITTADNTDTLSLISTDADANVGPNLRLYRNSSSPADDDLMGTIEFEGRNDNSQDVVYAQISIESSDVSDGTEDANWFVKVMSAGTLRNLLQLNASEIVFNQDSQDTNFRVESNGNPHMVSVDAGNDHVNIGTSSDLGGVLNVSGTGVFQTADNTNTLSLVSTDADATSGPRLSMRRESSSPADDDALAHIFFTGKDDGGNNTDYASILTTTKTVADGSENGLVEINVMSGGSSLEMAAFQGSVGTVFNESSNDLDFRVESNDNSHALFVDGGNNRIGIGSSSPDFTFHIRSMGSPSNDTVLCIEGGSTDANCRILFQNSAGSDEAAISYDTDDDNLQFILAGSENARFKAGNFLVGTNNADPASSGANGRVVINTANNGHAALTCFNTGTGAVNVISLENGNGQVGRVQISGSATSYLTSSDYRIKENVSYDFDATSRLKQLKPARFNFKTNVDETVDGFLAHEVSSIVPEAISGEKDKTETYTDDDGQQQTRPVYQGIDQSKLVPLLVKTVQELEARITTLEG